MTFSSEQISEIKNQLIQQINSTFPEDKKSEAIEKINLMNNEQLIEFLEQNNMIKDPNKENSEDSQEQCIFCSLLSGQIPSTKISENENAIAILELNPLTEGHTLIIPKIHQDKIPSEINQFTEEIKQKLNSSLNPKQILSENANLFGHEIINLIPIYTNEIPSQRNKSSPEELKRIQEKILSGSKKEAPKKEQEEKEIKPEKINPEKNIIPRRIP